MKNHPIALATSLLFALLAALLLLRRDGDVTRAQTPSDATAQTTSADSPIPGVPPTPAPPEERNAGEAPTARREAAPAERVPGTEPEEEVPEGLVVELRWSDGSPVPGAWVSLAKDGRRLETAYSDWKGRVHYGPLEEEGVWLYVANGSVRLASLPLGKRSGLVRVTLEEGSTVSGWVRIQGNAPDRSLNLHLVADPDGPAAPLMPALDDPMGGTVEADVADLWATTDEEGAFRFAGLPAHFRGSIQLPYGDEFVTGGSSLPVEAPTTDLILDIEARPVLRGRVVDGEGNPVPGAFVFADISTKEGGVGSAETADEEGRFTVALPESGLEQARLSISGLGTNTDVVVREFDPVRGADAGDIVLEREELDSADFLVTDSDGTPLPDAIVGVLSQTKTASSQGICSFEFPRTQGLQATVWAPDHVVRVLPVPPAADRPDGPIEV
ncbi:MAG TPA: carboxypeptidase regulatory-like domain-containing protein, partial [Planctomycetes bacterium]|nr:carboxypeptidase regulatory-like domain-containing protein [Planctomycetota bacterium]